MGYERSSTRGRLLAAVALLAAGCSPAGGGRPVVTPASLTVRDYEPARGAAALWASPDGTYLAAELVFAGAEVPSLIKVIERATDRVAAHARGSVLAGPDDRGEVLYVDTADPAQPRLRSTARAELAVALPAAPGFARWSGFRLGKTHDLMVVLRQEAAGVTLLALQLPEGKPVATRALPGAELALLAAAVSPTDDLLYLSGKTPGAAGGGAVIALDGVLAERWRAAWPAGHNFDQRPALGVSGDGAFVAAYAPSGLLALDARGGTGAAVHRFYGHDPAQLAGVPGRPALVALRSFHAQGERPSYSIEAIELPGGAVTKLRPEAGPMNPAALLVIGTTVLVAPGAPPRWLNDPATWGPELEGFVSR